MFYFHNFSFEYIDHPLVPFEFLSEAKCAASDDDGQVPSSIPSKRRPMCTAPSVICHVGETTRLDEGGREGCSNVGTGRTPEGFYPHDGRAWTRRWVGSFFRRDTLVRGKNFFSDRSMLSRKRRTLGFSCSPPDSAVLLTVMIAMGFGWEKISFLFKVFISNFFFNLQ